MFKVFWGGTLSLVKRGILYLLLPTVVSCATYQGKLKKGRELIQQGQPHQAAEAIKPFAEKESDDQLVYLFDYGTALQIAGDYQESNKALLLADDLSEIQDYHSISRIGGSLLFNEGMVQYKGDDFEKVIVNAMLAINFLMMGQLDSALVETRKINEKLYKYKFEGKLPYEQNEFAHYLAAMIWEADRKWDDAYIDYEKAYKLNPNIAYIKQDLIRAAYASRRMEDYEKWKSKFTGVAESQKWKDKKYGELIVIYQQGWGPRKHPHPNAASFPKLFPVKSYTTQANVVVDGSMEERTHFAYSVEKVAIKTLDDAYAGLIAKRLAAEATKQVVASQIDQKNKGWGQLAYLAMKITDRADLRQWSTLPETFQVARIPLKVGTHKVRVQGLNSHGASSGEEMESIDVTIRPGKKTFITWRSVQ